MLAGITLRVKLNLFAITDFASKAFCDIIKISTISYYSS